MGNIWPLEQLPGLFIQLLVLWLPPRGDGQTLLLRDSLRMTTKMVSLTPLDPLLSLHPLLTLSLMFPLSTTQLLLLSKPLSLSKLRLSKPLSLLMLHLMSTLATPSLTNP